MIVPLIFAVKKLSPLFDASIEYSSIAGAVPIGLAVFSMSYKIHVSDAFTFPVPSSDVRLTL